MGISVLKYFFLVLSIISIGLPNQIQEKKISSAKFLFGSIKVQTQPEGAEVRINGLFKGRSPLWVDNLEIGAHNLTLYFPGYEKINRIIVLKDSTLIEVNEYLLAKTGNLIVLSEPIGAKVYIDNVFINYTPLDIPELSVKKYNLRLELESHEFIYDEINIKEGRRLTKSYILNSQLGSVRIYTIPAGIKLNINDKTFINNAPEIIELDLKKGRYELEFLKYGYQSIKRDIVVKVNDNQSLKIFLKRIPNGISKLTNFGLLSVSSEEKDIKLKIKGIRGKFDIPLTYYELKEGDYQITLYAKGKRKEVLNITIERQKTTIIRAKLKPKEKILDYFF